MIVSSRYDVETMEYTGCGGRSHLTAVIAFPLNPGVTACENLIREGRRKGALEEWK
jgi:hypothetical protein